MTVSNVAGSIRGAAIRFALTLAIATGVCPGSAKAQTCAIQVGTTVGGVAPAETFINVYWSVSWDALPIAASAGLSRQAIDDYTRALVDSTYFDRAHVNYGSGLPTFSGSTVVGANPPMGDVNNAGMSTIVNAAVAAMFPTSGPSVAVNLFMPPGTRPLDQTVLNPAGSNCMGGGFSAFHAKANFTSTPFTAISLDPSCFSAVTNPDANQDGATFNTVMNALSHEMIELMTSPGGNGFNFNNDEIADICGLGGRGAVSPFATNPVPFLIAQAVTYFSNNDCACVPAWNGATMAFEPLLLSLTSSGSLGVQISGSMGAFGSLPPDFGTPSPTAPLTTNTPYLSLTATTADGSTTSFAGDSIDATHGLVAEQTAQITRWQPDQVQAIVPLSFVGWCDTVDLTVWNPKGGTASTASTIFGEGGFTIQVGVPSVSTAGRPETVTVTVRDSNAIPVPRAWVRLRATGGVLSPGSGMTGANGQLTVTFTPQRGTDTITASMMDCAGNLVQTPRSTTGCAIAGGMGRGTGQILLPALCLWLVALVRRRRIRAAETRAS